MTNTNDPLPQIPKDENGRKPNRSASDPQQVLRARLKEERHKDSLRAGWAFICSDPRGTLVLRELMKPLNRSPYSGHANECARNCGEFEAAQYVRMQILSTNPDVLVTLLQQEVLDLKTEQSQIAG